jgi:hypothetical protein
MKLIYKRTHRLVLVCLLKTFFCFAQPAIKVPPTCEVVYAGIGTGVTTGFGGVVGDGGIVAMPDPFDFTTSEGDFYYVSNDTELIEWNLLGDISMQTESTYDNVLQPTGPINPLNIQSYNKNLRLSENPSTSQPLLNNRWGRSKGRVIVIYNNKRCNFSIKFDILKRYKQNPDEKDPSVVPPIFGSDCVLPNTVYTYSVDQIASDNPNDEIGFDKYYWSGLPEGSLKLYNSTDNSAITFLTGESVYSFTLQCCYGRANEWDGDAESASHTTCMTKQIVALSTTPIYTSPPPTCHPTGMGSFTIVYTNPGSGIYTWTAPNTGWTINTSSTLTTTTVTVTTPNNNPGTLTLTINGPCLPVTINYQIDRNLVTPLAIVPTGTTTSTCIDANTSNNTYTISPNASGIPVTWSTVPAVVTGVTLVNANTNTVTVNTAGAALGTSFTLQVQASGSVSPCNTAISTSINVRPAVPTISGTACVVKGALTPQTYTCTATGATYIWQFPAGWTAGSFTTATNSITVTPASATAVLNGNVTVTALGTNGCNSAASTAFAINYNPIIPSAITFSNSCFNFGIATSGNITVTNAPSPFYGTYTVTSSPAGLFSTYSVNTTTGVISFTTNTAASGTYQITIAHVTTLCESAQNAVGFPVTIAGNGATVAITANVPGAGNCDQYTIFGAPGGSTYAWFVNGVQVFNSPTVNIYGNALTLCGTGAAPTSVCVNVTSGGCTTRVCPPAIGTHSAKQANSSGKIDGVVISPNPNNGNFSIKVNNFIESATAILTDVTGKEISSYILNKGENKIQNEGLTQGTYFVILIVDGKQETRQIIVK